MRIWLKPRLFNDPLEEFPTGLAVPPLQDSLWEEFGPSPTSDCMSSDQGPNSKDQRTPLPDSLKRQLEAFRGRLWFIKVAEALLAGLFGLLFSYGLECLRDVSVDQKTHRRLDPKPEHPRNQAF